MKAIAKVLLNKAVLHDFIDELYAMPLDGSKTAVIQDTRTKSAKQRGLQHIWYGDIVKSGTGGKYEEDEDILDVYVKYRWGIQIMTATREFLAEAFTEYSRMHGSDPDRMMWWTAQNIHTEQMTHNEMARFLTCIHRYYCIQHGVNLTNPDDYGWKGLMDLAEERTA